MQCGFKMFTRSAAQQLFANLRLKRYILVLLFTQLQTCVLLCIAIVLLEHFKLFAPMVVTLTMSQPHRDIVLWWNLGQICFKQG